MDPLLLQRPYVIGIGVRSRKDDKIDVPAQ